MNSKLSFFSKKIAISTSSKILIRSVSTNQEIKTSKGRGGKQRKWGFSLLSEPSGSKQPGEKNLLPPGLLTHPNIKSISEQQESDDHV